MKEATGEFSMTVVTIVAIAVIAGLVAWLSPKIAQYIQEGWDTATTGTTNTGAVCGNGEYLKNGKCVKY